MSDDKSAKPPDQSVVRKKPSLAELIAQTPGAQPRMELEKKIEERRQKRRLPQSPAAPDIDVAQPEPLPIIDKPDQFAADFFARLKQKEKEKPKPPKRSKPRLVIDNDKREPDV
jgi:hypothetical protein